MLGPARYRSELDQEEVFVPLAHYLWLLRSHGGKIAAFVVTCVVATAIVSSRLTPVYESTATIDIDRRMPTGVLGQEAMPYPTADADQFLATQMRLIQSDSVLRPAVERFNSLPRSNRNPPALRTANVEDAPVKLSNLKVTRPPNTYLLLINFRSTNPTLAADVANAIANSYILHTYNIRYASSASLSAFMEKQIEELRANMEKSEEALARFERELNVISPEEKTSILSARLLQLNTEYTNAQAERMKKDAAYSSVRGGSLEAALVSSQGEALKRLAERLDDAQEKFSQVQTHFGTNHPEYRKARTRVTQLERNLNQMLANTSEKVGIEYREALNREAMLKKAVAETKAEFDALNARSFEYQSLKREAEADKKLYEELITKIKEAGINAGFQSSSIRLADPARPALTPVSPNTRLNLILAFLLSSLVAVGAAILSDVLDRTIRDPEQVSRMLNTEVVGSLPMVKSWRRRLPTLAPGADPVLSAPTARNRNHVTASFDEAIRTLRNSVLLADFDQNLHSLLVTSACPSEGKTTTAAYLALAHAGRGHRTLLLDCDLRRPRLHQIFGVDGGRGLTQVISARSSWRQEVVHVGGAPNLALLPAGRPELGIAPLAGGAIQEILDQASKEYDLVVLDSPPVLGFSESFEMAICVDAVLMVTLAGHTDRKALGTALQALTRLRANVIGVVLNAVAPAASNGYYDYSYYRRYYRQQSQSDGV